MVAVHAAFTGMFILRISVLIRDSRLAAICRCAGSTAFGCDALMPSILRISVCIISIMAPFAARWVAPVIPAIGTELSRRLTPSREPASAVDAVVGAVESREAAVSFALAHAPSDTGVVHSKAGRVNRVMVIVS